MLRLISATLVVAALTGPVRADGPLAMQIAAMTSVKGLREACARRAVAALAAEHFPFAEVMADGNVQGWDGKSTVLVQSFQTPEVDRLFVFVFAASIENPEAVRLVNVIRTRLTSATPDGQDTPSRIAPADGKIPPRVASLCWRSKDITVTPLLRHLPAATSIVLEKCGMTCQVQPGLVCGSSASGIVAVFAAPTRTSVSFRMNVVTAVRGEVPSERLAEGILSRIMSIIYD